MIRFQQILNPKPRDLRIFAIGQLLFIIILFASQYGRHWPSWSGGLILTSLAVAIAGGLRPDWVRPLYVVWMSAFFPLGWLISQLILAVIYFAVLTPVALLVRSISGDPLRCKPDPSASTYWQPRPASGDSTSYFRQF
jgi:hypothetical protein